ncbi:hypothetical protein P167DRAFT_567690 [Morchella conica CCBAS932]|uniref:VWFA domain-containing protein n=1 Tax=Morchella conica CCBAS932 TaxID=1392247 RepID=A0A3N4KE13_9PEZI|nr:hypothetical protein P167DRAFT_567690 [Morchella conica CCBAS932]
MSCTCNTNVFGKLKELADSKASSKWDVLMVLGEMQKEIGRLLTETVSANDCPCHGNCVKKPPKTVQDFLDHINSVLKDQGLSDFYKPDDLRLKEIAEKAAEYAKNHPDGPLGKPEDTADLCQLGLYDNICFLDDSGSMKEDNRIQSLKEILKRVVSITGLLDFDGVQIRWLNYANDSTMNDIYEPAGLTPIFNVVKFDGSTPLGTKLKQKVIDPMIVAKLAGKQLKKPIIVSIITDGEPNEEPVDQLEKSIKECKDALVKNGYKENHVLFQISQIGNSKGAEKFLNDLKADKNIRRLLYLTSGSLDKQMELFHEQENELQKWLLNIMLAPVRPGASGP